ncbi:MAG: cytochrome c [Actinomycetes bacterium]
MILVAIFIGIFLISGVVVIAAGFSSKRQAKAAGSSGSGKLLYIGVALCVVGIGLAIPGLLLVNNGTKTSRDASGGVVLTANQESGRVLFAQNCSTCHTLQASGSAGQTGPNLDYMHPPEALILNAIQIGRARGNGNMPAGLVTGNQAKDVASYVSAVAGQGLVAGENASVSTP